MEINNMKRILFLSMIALLFASCDKFLESYPKTQLNDGEFYNTQEGVMMGLYGVMNTLNNDLMTLYSTFIYISDEGESGGGPGEGGFGLDLFQYDYSNCPNWWGGEWDLGMYKGIARCNMLLSKLDGADISPQVRERVKAEVTLARVIFYYYLFIGYEQFVIIDHVITPGEMYNVRKSSREECYQFILNDLTNDVIGHLPITVPANEAGRYTNDAALVIKTKLILFARDESRYSEALADIKTVISSNRYDLYPNFQSLWLQEGEFCNESLLEFVFTDKANSNDWGGENTGVAFKIVTWVSGRDISDPRSAEEGGLGGGWGQATVKRNVYDWYESGDVRREGTFIDYEVEKQKVMGLGYGDVFYVAANQISYDGLGNYKYHARKGYTSATATSYLNYNNNFRYLRFADVLLLGAELSARAHGGTADAEGQAWFDKIRDRAWGYYPNTPPNTLHRKTATLNNIFNERGLEFAYEMQRWVDLMRFDKGAEILGAKGWTEKFRYMPISQMDIEESNGALTQNPGWQ